MNQATKGDRGRESCLGRQKRRIARLPQKRYAVHSRLEVRRSNGRPKKGREDVKTKTPRFDCQLAGEVIPQYRKEGIANTTIEGKGGGQVRKPGERKTSVLGLWPRKKNKHKRLDSTKIGVRYPKNHADNLKRGSRLAERRQWNQRGRRGED